MGNIKIRRGVFDTKLELEHAGIKAGFPSPADDYRHETLDFNRDYIRHPEASFYGDVEGDSMKDAGLFDGDRVIIDRAVEPHEGSIVVAWWDGGFTMKFLDLTHKNDGYIELRPANDDYPVFRVDDPNELGSTICNRSTITIKRMDGSVENIYSTYDNKTLYITGESMRKFFKIMDEGNLKMNIKVHTIYGQPDCDVTLRFNVVNELIGAENAKRVADEKR